MPPAAPSVKQLFGLTGRVALVTGATMGVGREIAPGLIEAGAKVAPGGIRVNAISPGGVFQHQDPEFGRRYSQAVALGRRAREGFDIKGAAVFMARDAAAYVTGENLGVDGGFVCCK